MPPTTDQNPYAPPTTVEPGAASRKFKWRLIPAGLFLLVGCASFAFGLFAVAVMVATVLTGTSGETLIFMLAGCALYLGVGIAWIIAGFLFWSASYQFAITATAIGILIPVILFSILGV